MRLRLIITFFFSLHLFLLFAQRDSAAIDTTDIRYRIGYEIGSWLPFLVIFTLALMVIIRTWNLSRKNRKM